MQEEPWYKVISRILNDRNDRCKIAGKGQIYEDANGRNPYHFKTAKDLNQFIPFSSKVDCRFERKPTKKDPTDRFYVDAGNKVECVMANGHWSLSPSRLTRGLGDGVCWVNASDAQCGHHMSRNGIMTRDAESEAKCAKDDACRVAEMKSGAKDCVSKESFSMLKHKPVAKSLPSDFSMENSKDHIQVYLKEWYEGKKGSKPLVGSLTSAMKNTSRCSSSALPSTLDPNQFHAREVLKLIPFPLADHNREILIHAIGDKKVLKLEAIHGRTDLKKEVIESRVDEVWAKIHDEDLYFGKDDYIQERQPDMLPTYPQSVVHMLSKSMVDSNNRGILAWHSTGSGKCHAKDTPILMYDGTVKKVQDIKINDVLMGDDSTPRRVLSLASGRDEMYDIIPVKGETYTVNAAHILCLRPTFKESVTYMERQKNFPFKAVHIDNKEIKLKSKSFKTREEAVDYMKSLTVQDKTIEIEVQDYLKLAKNLQKGLKGYRTGVEFKSSKVDFDPYIIGIWLGDGTTSRSSITNQDARILHHLINHKHIPMLYKVNDREVRLAVLAGILDSDGSLSSHSCYDVIQKSKTLADDIVFLARSLGFSAYQKECTKSCVYKGEKKEGIYYRCSISGAGLEQIPVKVLRKTSTKRRQIKDTLVTGITVKHVGRGDYYGFTLDGNNRYLLGDFTVTHNTCTATGVMKSFWDTDRQIVFASSIAAISSNPPFVFHQCMSRLYDQHKTEAEISRDFSQRSVLFISFAKLANRIEKTEKFKQILLKSKPKAVEAKVKKPTADTAKKAKKVKAGGGGGEGSPFLQRLERWYGIDMDQVKQALKDAKISGPDDFVDLDHAVLIIDEVHNLFRPLANQKAKHQYVEKHIVDTREHPTLKLVILTATPGDNVSDVMKLLNILRSPKNPVLLPPNPDQLEDVLRFKKDIRGMISYFEMSGDESRFPRVIDHGPKLFPMSQKQFSKYVEAYKETKDASKNYESLAKQNQLNKYWSGARKYSNSMYQEFDKLDKDLQLSEFSVKMPALLECIESKTDEKHYVYSAFYERRGSSQGILAIATELERLGYEKLTVKMARSVNKGTVKLEKRKKRYILAIQSEFGEEGSANADKNLREMMTVYNSTENKEGALVSVFLASQNYNEGLDLKAVRHIHIFEPLVTMASDLQTIGRARRYCSHADLDIATGQWTVEIHRYFSDLPRMDINVMDEEPKLQAEVERLKEAVEAAKRGEKTALKQALKAKQTELKSLQTAQKKASNIEAIDQKVYDMAQNKMRDLFTIYHCMKEAAVDCMILHHFHNDPSIKCVDTHA